MSGEDALDVSSKDRQAWLVKLPEKVLKMVRESPANTKVGRIRMYKKAGPGRPSMKLFVDSATGGAAREYDLIPNSSEQPPTYTFRDSWHGPRHIYGTIREKIDARPVLSREYKSELRQREAQSSKRGRRKGRGMQVMDDSNAPRVQAIQPETHAEAMKKEQEKAVKRERIIQDKRLRIDSADLRSKLFIAFEQKPLWSKKELLEFTHQPEQWLKQHMDELCEFHKSGQAHGLYSLKESYQSTRSRPTKKPKTS